jgi:hypothetical protein
MSIQIHCSRAWWGGLVVAHDLNLLICFLTVDLFVAVQESNKWYPECRGTLVDKKIFSTEK